MNGTVKIQLKIGWSFSLRDHLPDDFSGTRAEAIKYLKDDIAENLGDYLTLDEIINNLKEVK